MKLTIDSPTSKLLYNKEVQGYKARVKAFYRDIKELPRVPEDAMQYYLKQLSTVSQCDIPLHRDTLRTHNCSLEGATELKFAPFCSS